MILTILDAILFLLSEYWSSFQIVIWVPNTRHPEDFLQIKSGIRIPAVEDIGESKPWADFTLPESVSG